MRVAASVLLLAALAACGTDGDVEVRTFALERMTAEDAVQLLTPYVRENGSLSGRGSLVTVREDPEQLERIAEVLAQYDGAPAQVRVDVYILEGGSFADSTGLPFEATLRDMLPYGGYRLLGQATFGASEWSDFGRRGDGRFQINGAVQEVRTDGEDASASIRLSVNGIVNGQHEEIGSTVNAPLGETVVVASHRTGGDGSAMIVALRAELVSAPAARAAQRTDREN